MLDPTIRKFLSNIGKKGGTKTSQTYDMAEWGKRGGLKKAENRLAKMTPNEREQFIHKRNRKRLTEKQLAN